MTSDYEGTMDTLMDLAAGTSGTDFFELINQRGMSQDDSFGFALQLGFDDPLKANFGLHAADTNSPGKNNTPRSLGSDSFARKARADLAVGGVLAVRN